MCGVEGDGEGRRHGDHSATCDVITGSEKIATFPLGKVYFTFLPQIVSKL
jgi:hypothetical protein